MKLPLLLASIVILYHVVPSMIASLYSAHGHGDQTKAFLVVLASFCSPALFPLLQLKTLVTHVILPAMNLQRMESHVTYAVGRLVLTPYGDFDRAKAPPRPDYFDERFWSMLPDRKDSPRHDASENVVPGSSRSDPDKICSAFYLHPSTWYTSFSWNAYADHPVTTYLSDDAIGPQHANAFNSACRIFAPRFRQMAAAGFLQEGGLRNANSKQALDLAYEDVKAAFEHFLKHYHKGEPIVLVGHSQGSVHAARLLKEFFEQPNLHPFLGAAYLPGWTLFARDFQGLVKVCSAPDQVGCVISWRTYARGGDVEGFLHIEHENHPDANDRICVNPLSWTTDVEYVNASRNLGGLEVMHYTTMFRYLIGYQSPKERVRPPALIPNITDAQCIDGHLFITPPKHYGYGWGIIPFPAWTFASFPGFNLHTYDFNFFFENIRENVRFRMKKWWEQKNKK